MALQALQGFGTKRKALTCTGQIFQSTRVTWDVFIFTAITQGCSCAKHFYLFVVKNVIGTYRLPIDGGYQLEVT